MSGCSGNQAVAVSMRELSLGVATPADILYVLGKELAVGLVNGTALGLLLGAVSFAWMGNPWLGLVAGGALAANTLIAVSIGGTVPLFAKKMGFDPALASGPVLTTITDVCGFALALGGATLVLDKLV
jgi:magnesium transporter